MMIKSDHHTAEFSIILIPGILLELRIQRNFLLRNWQIFVFTFSKFSCAQNAAYAAGFFRLDVVVQVGVRDTPAHQIEKALAFL